MRNVVLFTIFALIFSSCIIQRPSNDSVDSTINVFDTIDVFYNDIDHEICVSDISSSDTNTSDIIQDQETQQNDIEDKKIVHIPVIIEESTSENPGIFGRSVSGGGNINGDQYDDIIIGMPSYPIGKAYIYLGSENFDDLPDIELTGEEDGDQFGIVVNIVGDVNNDGFDDWIVNAKNYGYKLGRVYLYFGSKTPDNIPDVIFDRPDESPMFGESVDGAGDVNGDGYDDIIIGQHVPFVSKAYIYFGGESVDNEIDITLEGETLDEYFGYSVSSAGDVNNDGFDDVIVGEYVYDNVRGRVLIFYGGEKMDNIPDVVLQGENENNFFGFSVSDAGDVNGDDFDDIIVSAFHYDGNGQGRAYIYYGGDSMDDTVDATFSGDMQNEYFGYAVSAIGNIDNDLYSDIIIGATYVDGPYVDGPDGGTAYVFNGNKDSLGLSSLSISGDEQSYFGISVSTAGDVNNDGIHDFLIGAPYWDGQKGRVYVYISE